MKFSALALHQALPFSGLDVDGVVSTGTMPRRRDEGPFGPVLLQSNVGGAASGGGGGGGGSAASDDASSASGADSGADSDAARTGAGGASDDDGSDAGGAVAEAGAEAEAEADADAADDAAADDAAADDADTPNHANRTVWLGDDDEGFEEAACAAYNEYLNGLSSDDEDDEEDDERPDFDEETRRFVIEEKIKEEEKALRGAEQVLAHKEAAVRIAQAELSKVYQDNEMECKLRPNRELLRNRKGLKTQYCEFTEAAAVAKQVVESRRKKIASLKVELNFNQEQHLKDSAVAFYRLQRKLAESDAISSVCVNPEEKKIHLTFQRLRVANGAGSHIAEEDVVEVEVNAAEGIDVPSVKRDVHVETLRHQWAAARCNERRAERNAKEKKATEARARAAQMADYNRLVGEDKAIPHFPGRTRAERASALAAASAPAQPKGIAGATRSAQKKKKERKADGIPTNGVPTDIVADDIGSVAGDTLTYDDAIFAYTHDQLAGHIEAIDFDTIVDRKGWFKMVVGPLMPSKTLCKIITSNLKPNEKNKAAGVLLEALKKTNYGKSKWVARKIHGLAVEAGYAHLAYLPQTFTEELDEVIIFDKQPWSEHYYSPTHPCEGFKNVTKEEKKTLQDIPLPEPGKGLGQLVARACIILGCIFEETAGEDCLDPKSDALEKFFK